MDNKDVVVDKKLFDQTFPLLDKFKEIAPGTFKHCQNVSNICETVAIELGLNVDLLKLSALYHDIGKMNNSLYFAENQGDENIHDSLDPTISYQVISRHVGDSIIHLLQVPDFPIEAIKIISQHHGDSVLQAFYNKAKNIPEDKFRYRCSKPITSEALILMLCDSVEATTRALFSTGDKNGFIEKAVSGTINRLMDDHQLDNMRIGTLNITKKILLKELESIYHKRVTYDDKTATIGESMGDEDV
jgi:putative nucleotidyltransferase with HDIG domain